MGAMLPRRVSPMERRVSKFQREPVSVKNALAVIVTATTIVVVASGVAMRIFDPHNFSNVWIGMWWSVQTVTTVGYGDITPTDVAGRIVAAIVMLTGIAFVSITTSAITSSFVARAQEERRRAAAKDQNVASDRSEARYDELTERLDRIESMLRDLSSR
jgi:voltage-gated potassium channel